jgi:hypothetical protein
MGVRAGTSNGGEVQDREALVADAILSGIIFIKSSLAPGMVFAHDRAAWQQGS